MHREVQCRQHTYLLDYMEQTHAYHQSECTLHGAVQNPRDAGQFSVLARQMYPSGFKFAEEAYRDATERPFGYLFVDLKHQQDERYRLRTNVFLGEKQYVYVKKS